MQTLPIAIPTGGYPWSPPEPSRGEVIQLAPYRRRLGEAQRDASLNDDWNALAGAVAEAWCWRDPESLAAVEECLARLKAKTLADWTD
jgi:hypothetical protein